MQFASLGRNENNFKNEKFQLVAKNIPNHQQGGNSSATCNKDDLFARLGLQQEVSTHELLLHGLKNKQPVPLAGLPP